MNEWAIAFSISIFLFALLTVTYWIWDEFDWWGIGVFYGCLAGFAGSVWLVKMAVFEV